VEVTHHRQASQLAQARLDELLQQLDDIISCLSDGFPSLEGEPWIQPNSKLVELHEPNFSLSLWEKVRSFITGSPYLKPQTNTIITKPPGELPRNPFQNLVANQPAFDGSKYDRSQQQPSEDSSAQTRQAPNIFVRMNEPCLVVYCLGPFRVYQNETPVDEWPSAKGKAIFKYLITHRQRPVGKEVLMDIFWRDVAPDAARNNLNVAIYGLRQALRNDNPEFSHLLFQGDSYTFNPDLQIWLDWEAFNQSQTRARSLEQSGDLVLAAREYTAAEALYAGEFLEEDRYDDWPIPQREAASNDYLRLLDWLSRYSHDRCDLVACRILCLKMLAVDPCNEQAHRRLMRCYLQEGQPHLALRQYHLCFETLKRELELAPSQKTRAIYRRIRSGEV
jgi:DNA-binding SARP family transcriptional activator